MNWHNLKENKCPKCSKDIMVGAERIVTKTGEKVLLHYCGFKIREMRMAQIVSSQINQDLIDKAEEDISALRG